MCDTSKFFLSFSRIFYLCLSVVIVAPASATVLDGVSLFELSLQELTELKVVTAASGVDQSLYDAPGAVTVISRSEWQAMGARSLTDVLQAVPGLHVGLSTKGLARPIISIRGITGASGERVLILIDGIPFKYHQNSGRFAGERMPLDAYSRVEVIRSPGSAVYGADAVGGVINLVTDTGHLHDSLILSARTGSFNTTDLALTSRQKIRDVNTLLSLSYSKSDGDPDNLVERDLQSVFDDILDSSASLAPGEFDEKYEVYDAHLQAQWQRFDFRSHLWGNRNGALGAGVAQALDTQGSVKIQNEQYQLSMDALQTDTQNLRVELAYNYQASNTKLWVFPEGTRLPIGDDGNVDFTNPVGTVDFPDGFIGTPSTKSSAVSFQLLHTINLDKHDFRWALGHEKQQFVAYERKNFGPSVIDGTQTVVDGTLTDVTGTPFVYIPANKRELTYLSLQDQWQLIPSLSASVGIRFDSYSDFGFTSNPRINLKWQASPTLSLNVFAGTAFRAPSIEELYADNNPVASGNPNLDAEKAKTLESGFSAMFRPSGSVEIITSIYQYDISNIIVQQDDVDNGGSQAVNSGKQKGLGAEFEASWKVTPNFIMKGHVAVVDAEDTLGNDLANTPKTLAYLQGHWRLSPQLQAFLSTKWVGERPRAFSDTRDSLDGYAWAKAKITWTEDKYTFALIADNLFDEDAREPSNSSVPNDYPLQGRQLLFEASYTF